jgi:hypothetical protein
MERPATLAARSGEKPSSVRLFSPGAAPVATQGRRVANARQFVAEHRHSSNIEKETIMNRMFLLMAAVVAAVFLFAAACSDDDGGIVETVGTEPLGTCVIVNQSLSSNHGHTFDNPDLTSTADVELPISECPCDPHTHTITFKVAELENISMCGTEINTSTSNSGHDHDMTLIGG